MQRVVEIILYVLNPGAGADFLEIMTRASVPLQTERGVDVVWHGQSLHDPDCYGLIRAYPDAETLDASQSTFYESDEWRLGPREGIVSRIASANKIVVSMSDEAIDALRSACCFNGKVGIHAR